MGIFGRQPGQPRYSGELHNLQVTESVYGTVLTVVIGTTRVHGKLLWYGGFKAKQASGGGKGIFGGKGEQFEYSANCAIALAQGPAQALLNIWDQNGKLENLSSTYNYTIPGGGGSVIPSSNPVVQEDLGVVSPQPYSVVANDYGSPGTTTLTGTQNVPFNRVSGTPGAGQYSFDASTGQYTFSAADAGKVVAISYSTVFSLYYYEATQAAVIPNSPYQVSTDNQSYFQADQGVTFYSTADGNVAGTPVGGTPSAPYQYHESGGVYTFYSGDVGKTVYIKYEYFSSDPNLTNQSYLNLTFFNGAQGQSPWAFLLSNYPSDAFGYSAICYVGAAPMALGESAVLPSYNYELMGTAIAPGQIDADLTLAMAAILTDPLFGVNFPSGNLGNWTNAQAYFGSNSFFISQELSTAQSAATTIQRWLEAGNTEAFFSEGLLKLAPYGDTTSVGNGFTYQPQTNPVVTLTYDDMLPFTDQQTGQATSDDPIQVERNQPQDRWNWTQVQWTNRLNDYNNEITSEWNDAFIQKYGLRMESAQTWDFLTNQEAVTWALKLRLNRNLYITNTYKFRLKFTFSYIEPMDVVVLPTGESVRIKEIEEDDSGAFTITAENFNYGSANVTLYTKQPSNSYQPQLSQAHPGNSVPIFIQNTTTQSNGILNKLQIGAVGQTQNWGGCNVYVSLDGTNYTQIGQLKSTGVIGLLSANLASSVDPDSTDTLSVDLTLSLLSNIEAELVTVTQQQADSFVSLCAIVDQGGLTNELISYETATLTAQGRYNLTYLRRGVYATPIAAHTTGASFAFLGPNYAFLDYQYWPQYIGQALFVKLQSFNLMGGQTQNLSQVKPWQLFINSQGSSFELPTALRPSTYTASPGTAGTISNPTFAYDLDFSTFATIDSGFIGTTTTANVKYSGFGAGITPAPLNLYMKFEVPFANGQNIDIEISFDNGATFPFGYNGVGAIGQPYSTALPVPQGTDISKIIVSATANSSISRSSLIYLYEIWIQ